LRCPVQVVAPDSRLIVYRPLRTDNHPQSATTTYNFPLNHNTL
jgi:hypothetical protein